MKSVLRFLMTLFLCCVISVVVVVVVDADEYDDARARNYMLPIAAAAYTNSPNVCINNWLSNATVYRQRSIKCSSLNDEICSGFTAVADYPDFAIIISFKGSENFIQNISKNGNWNYDEMVPFVAGGKVGKYFFDALNALWFDAGMVDDFNTLKNRYPYYNFWITGHSFGGALASLTAASLTSTGTIGANNIYLYTFGQPRIGDKDFVQIFKKGMDSHRIIHNHDLVPHLPPTNTSSNYFHHPVEIWYPNDMKFGDNFDECNAVNGEDPECSNGDSAKLNLDDHKIYFGKVVNKWGFNGCQKQTML